MVTRTVVGSGRRAVNGNKDCGIRGVVGGQAMLGKSP